MIDLLSPTSSAYVDKSLSVICHSCEVPQTEGGILDIQTKCGINSYDCLEGKPFLNFRALECV